MNPQLSFAYPFLVALHILHIMEYLPSYCIRLILLNVPGILMHTPWLKCHPTNFQAHKNFLYWRLWLASPVQLLLQNARFATANCLLADPNNKNPIGHNNKIQILPLENGFRNIQNIHASSQVLHAVIKL